MHRLRKIENEMISVQNADRSNLPAQRFSVVYFYLNRGCGSSNAVSAPMLQPQECLVDRSIYSMIEFLFVNVRNAHTSIKKFGQVPFLEKFCRKRNHMNHCSLSEEKFHKWKCIEVSNK